MVKSKINTSLYSLCTIISGSLISCNLDFKGNNMKWSLPKVVNCNYQNEDEEKSGFRERSKSAPGQPRMRINLYREDIKCLARESLRKFIEILNENSSSKDSKEVIKFENSFVDSFTSAFFHDKKGYREKKSLAQIESMLKEDVANFSEEYEEIYGSSEERKNQQNEYYLKCMNKLLREEKFLSIDRLNTMQNLTKMCFVCKKYLPSIVNKFLWIVEDVRLTAKESGFHNNLDRENLEMLFRQCETCKKIIHSDCYTKWHKETKKNNCPLCYEDFGKNCKDDLLDIIKTGSISIISQTPDSNKLLLMGDKCNNAKKFDQALECYIKVYEREPDICKNKIKIILDKKISRGNYHFNNGNYPRALEYYKFAYDKKPKDDSYYKDIEIVLDKIIAMGNEYFLKKSFRDAVAFYVEAQERGCKNVDEKKMNEALDRILDNDNMDVQDPKEEAKISMIKSPNTLKPKKK